LRRRHLGKFLAATGGGLEGKKTMTPKNATVQQKAI
jgi:hypothetical protein